jgi:hypothetical protein
MKDKKKVDLSKIALILALIPLWLIIAFMWVAAFVDSWCWAILAGIFTFVAVALTLVLIDNLRN